MATIKADRKKTTSILKRHLFQKFGITCSIRSEIYSGGSSLNISYYNGPQSKMIEEVVKNLQQGNFNRMEDIYEYSKDSGLTLEGYELETFKYVFVSRELNENIRFQMCKALEKTHKYEGMHNINNIDDTYKSFDRETYVNAGYVWTWAEVLRRYTNKINFNTQDTEKITILRAERKNDIEGFYYTVDGIEYHTSEYNIPQAPKETRPEPVEVPAGKVQFVDYSPKAFAVIGDTRPIKDKLKELGGSFNSRLTCGAGWIFSKTKLETVKAAFQN